MKIDTYKNVFFQLAKNKGVEFQISRWRAAPRFAFYFYVMKGDHKGFRGGITVFRHELSLDFYDFRHEDDYKND